MTNHLLPPSLQSIANHLHQNRLLTPGQMRKLLLDAAVRPEELLPWADFDHPDADSYGRKMAYKGPNFEIMVMSWKPGDFSSIHDHGHTQWGAVQVFGPAEHATFRVDSGRISTLARWQMEPYEAVGVHHDLVHQMGNPTADQPFLSLHIYGEPEDDPSITGDARVFDLFKQQIQRVNGGVFFALPPTAIGSTEPAPVPDFPTKIRFHIELFRRMRQMAPSDYQRSGYTLEEVQAAIFAPENRNFLLRCLEANANTDGRQTNSVYWRILNRELKEAAKLQRELQDEQAQSDRFHRYAEFYDAVIGQPSFDQFMRQYLEFFTRQYGISWPDQTVLSLGCGTGLAERHLIDQFHVPYAQLWGTDISPAMLAEARKRIQAWELDLLHMEENTGGHAWDIVYSGLNVFHYLPHTAFEQAVKTAASQLRPGGYFLGDFITPDHIRWYPNILYSGDKQVISLRTPQLIEEQGAMFQESEIVNISFADGPMEVTYAGKHQRFLPPMNRVRRYFERYFASGVDLYDAVTLAPIPEAADSCPSTRYIVIAKK
ncbi:MAG: Trans-aconitate 2-methyltransferase [Haliscomenobacter sp.]|nr:Trans-aconitate 2-methyltransferase [Haliscomenobacter sp.]